MEQEPPKSVKPRFYEVRYYKFTNVDVALSDGEGSRRHQKQKEDLQ